MLDKDIRNTTALTRIYFEHQDIKQEIESLIKHLREVADDNHDEGRDLQGTMNELAEFRFGYAEGLDYAVTMLKSISR